MDESTRQGRCTIGVETNDNSVNEFHSKQIVMAELDREQLKKKLMKHVPQDGTSVSNMALREKLRWEPAKYQELRDELVQENLLQLWRGRGGTVRRVITPQEEILIEEKESPAKYEAREQKLYPGFLRALQSWAKDQSWTDHLVIQTANQGRRSTGGIWTRPDFVVVGYRKFEYTPGIVRDLETFEIKTCSCGVEAVFETAAHSRIATKSYVAIQLENDLPSPQVLDRIESECLRFGVGLILFTDGDTNDNWEYRVEPTRQEPDPATLEQFVSEQIPKSEQERIRKWF